MSSYQKETKHVCISWTDHSQVMQLFEAFRKEEELTDVTLSCEGRFIKAHKMLLSVGSNYFRNTFKSLPFSAHPIVILKGVSYSDLQNIISFMYIGKASINQSQLTSFLDAARFLEVKGLSNIDLSQIRDATSNEQVAQPVHEKPSALPETKDESSFADPSKRRKLASPLLQKRMPITALSSSLTKVTAPRSVVAPGQCGMMSHQTETLSFYQCTETDSTGQLPEIHDSDHDAMDQSIGNIDGSAKFDPENIVELSQVPEHIMTSEMALEPETNVMPQPGPSRTVFETTDVECPIVVNISSNVHRSNENLGARLEVSSHTSNAKTLEAQQGGSSDVLVDIGNGVYISGAQLSKLEEIDDCNKFARSLIRAVFNEDELLGRSLYGLECKANKHMAPRPSIDARRRDAVMEYTHKRYGLLVENFVGDPEGTKRIKHVQAKIKCSIGDMLRRMNYELSKSEKSRLRSEAV